MKKITDKIILITLITLVAVWLLVSLFNFSNRTHKEAMNDCIDNAINPAVCY